MLNHEITGIAGELEHINPAPISLFDCCETCKSPLKTVIELSKKDRRKSWEKDYAGNFIVCPNHCPSPQKRVTRL